MQIMRLNGSVFDANQQLSSSNFGWRARYSVTCLLTSLRPGFSNKMAEITQPQLAAQPLPVSCFAPAFLKAGSAQWARVQPVPP